MTYSSKQADPRAAELRPAQLSVQPNRDFSEQPVSCAETRLAEKLDAPTTVSQLEHTQQQDAWSGEGPSAAPNQIREWAIAKPRRSVAT
jgi:hypothetical protein